MKRARRILTAILAVALIGLARGSSMPSFTGGTGWLNGDALTPAALRGKVVLVDFWEYTCINCLRTLPYLRTWYRRYHHEGFEIVGVQTPEFAFSGERKHIVDAVKRLGITWPVEIDANHTLWNRFGVQAWPTEMLFDQRGRLVDTSVGEGNYQRTEYIIQGLLHLGNPALKFPPLMPLLPQDSYDKPGAVCYPRTAEILLEHQRVANGPSSGNPMRDYTYAAPSDFVDGQVYLDGSWHASKQAVIYNAGGGFFGLKYHAIQVAVVMTPEHRKPTRVNITQDGKPIPRDDAGKDIRYARSGMSYVLVDASREYDVVMNAKFGTHVLRLYPQAYGLAVYDVAFESCEVPGSNKR